MQSIQIYCKYCDFYLGNNERFTFYQQSVHGHHLILKPEIKNTILNDFKIVEQPEKSLENLHLKLFYAKVVT